MTGIYGALQAIGYGLLVLFFAAGVVKTCGSFAEVRRPEQALKLFVRFALAKAAVDYGLDLMLSWMQTTRPPWIAKRTIDDGIVPVLPYTRYKGAKDAYRPWDYTYIPEKDVYLCPQGAELRHTTTDKDGKRVYRSTPKNCRDCPYKAKCGANEKGQKLLTRHIWQSYLDAVECIRKTEDAKCIYAMRQQTIERVFADAKEKHAMRYTHHRGLTAVTRWVKLKFAAMNLKKLAVWSWKDSFLLLLSLFPTRVFHKTRQNPCLAAC